MTTNFARHSGRHDRGGRNQRERAGHDRRQLPAVAGVAGFAIALLLHGGSAFANEDASFRYPETKQGDVVEEQFGTAIPDPYRWLEGDIRQNAEVARWVEAQNGVSAP